MGSRGQVLRQQAGLSVDEASRTIKRRLEADYYYTATIHLALEKVNPNFSLGFVYLSGEINKVGSVPIYAALEHIQLNLVEALQDLGATPLQTFWKVVFPLSIPGDVAGATFAFVLSLGDFLAPLLLGGPSGIMISNIVVSLFGAAYNWPLGAAISLGMLLVVVSLLLLSERLEKKWSFS